MGLNTFIHLLVLVWTFRSGIGRIAGHGKAKPWNPFLSLVVKKTAKGTFSYRRMITPKETIR